MKDENMDVISINSSLILYQTEDGQSKIEVRLQDETVWLNQAQLCELFDKDKRTISEHIQNIFREGELSSDSTIRKFRTVQTEGAREVARQIDFYNLDVIISIGYRVSSHRGTQFRIWATNRLKEYLIKGLRLTMSDLNEEVEGIISMNFWLGSEISAPLKKYSGAKYLTSMPQVLTTTQKPKAQNSFCSSTKQNALGCSWAYCR